MESINENPIILFLHGYAQSGHIFNIRTKNIQKHFSKKYNNKLIYLFPDAPYILEEQKLEGETQRGWTTFSNIENFYNKKTIEYNGLENSIKNIFEIGEKNNNIQCIFSFSQGTVILLFIIILSLYNNDEFNFKKFFPNLKCCILCSGFYRPLPETDLFKNFVDELNKNNIEVKKFDIPILNVFGENDQYVTNDKSEEIVKLFDKYEVFKHKGKHFVPSTKHDILIYENFLDKYLEFK